MADVKACCANPENRAEGAGPRGLGGHTPPEGVTVTHCAVCECRHFEVDVDPLVLNLTGASL